MNVWFLNIKDNRIIGGELVKPHKENQQFNRIVTEEGPVRVVPSTTKLWTNKQDLVVNTLAKQYKQTGNMPDAINIFGLEENEAKEYVDFALKKFPEKFI